MTHSIGLRLLAGLVLFVSVSSAEAAKVQPPSVVLGAPTTTLVVAVYRDEGPGDRIVFETERKLAGAFEVPELIDLARPDLDAPLRAGERYVLAYTVFKNDRTRRNATNVRGAMFVGSPGAQPGLWPYSKAVEDMVMWRIGNDDEAMRSAAPRLIQMLRSRDDSMQRFAAAEFAYRASQLNALTTAQKRQLVAFVRGDGAPDAARAQVLLAAGHMPDRDGGQSQWNAVAERIIARSPVDVLAMRERSELLLAAFQHIDDNKVALPDRSLQRWLSSDDANLSERALLRLRRQSPESERSALDKALALDDIPPATRTFLVDHRRRLEAMRAAN